MLGRNPHQQELPFSRPVAERIARGISGTNASGAYVENYLRRRLFRQEAWVEDTKTGEYQCQLERFSLVGTEEQLTEAAKRIIGGRAYGNDRTHDDEVKVIFANEPDKQAMVTIRISSATYRQLVSQHALSASPSTQACSR